MKAEDIEAAINVFLPAVVKEIGGMSARIVDKQYHPYLSFTMVFEHPSFNITEYQPGRMPPTGPLYGRITVERWVLTRSRKQVVKTIRYQVEGLAKDLKETIQKHERDHLTGGDDSN